MNTSIFARPAIVLDTHHRRIVQRMGLVPAKADTTRAYDALMPAIPPEWTAAKMDEHHLLTKTLGQTICRPSSIARDARCGRIATPEPRRAPNADTVCPDC